MHVPVKQPTKPSDLDPRSFLCMSTGWASTSGTAAPTSRTSVSSTRLEAAEACRATQRPLSQPGELMWRKQEWRYGDIYGGKRYSERKVLRKVRSLLATQVWDLQVRVATYRRSSGPVSGSQEAQDRSVHLLAAIPYHQVAVSLYSAVDHLVGLRALLSTRRSVPAYSAYTLIRSSLEGSMGAWRLLDAPTREEAFVEGLARWKKDSRYSLNAIRPALDSEEARAWASVQALLDELGTSDADESLEEAVQWATGEARRLGWLPPDGKIPSPSSITSDFAALWPGNPDFGRSTYNLLSGAAHGQPWAAEALAWPRVDMKAGRLYMRTVEPKMPFIHHHTEMAVNWAFKSIGRAMQLRAIPLEGGDRKE